MLEIVGPEKRRLFEVVERLLETIYSVIVIMGRSFKVWRLFNVDFMIDCWFEECRLNIKLVYEQMPRGHDCKDEPNRGSLDNRGKGISVVNARDLCKTLCDKTCFESQICLFRILDFEYKLSANDFAI